MTSAVSLVQLAEALRLELLARVREAVRRSIVEVMVRERPPC
jgi:hypothetical protein